MKKATIQLATLIAIAAMATACGTDSETKTAATDSGSATDGTVADGTAADAGTTDGTAAGDVALSGDTTTTTDAGAATTNFGKGCSGADDQAFLGSLQKDATKGKAMADLVGDCTLKKGCLAKADAQAKKDCIVKCIVEDKVATDNKLSQDCASCLGIYKGFCGADKCIAKCAADTASQKCADCLKDNCDGEYDKCIAGDK